MKLRFLRAAGVGSLAAGLVALLVGLPLALTHRQELPLERAYGNAAVALVSRLLGGDAPNPRANDPRAATAGRAAFVGSCALCHGAKGDGRGRFGPSTYPDAANLLSTRTQEKSDAQLFWIVKNGLGFTAMPAFGDTYQDEDLWAIVVYIRALQRGAGTALVVPEATQAQLFLANTLGDRVARGAAVYFAQGCHLCHGPEGDAAGDLSLRGRVGTDEVRKGNRQGMPAFGKDRISDAELADLEAYLLRFAAVPSSPD
ncbi:MAG TPA: c-type cytochrome [Candidatus Limnocylindria bacterium]|jgi:mono/diheme cytochrome c family protein|nr:c-type cytochrome [Candidatus Limnocylindria bacterium]